MSRVRSKPWTSGFELPLGQAQWIVPSCTAATVLIVSPIDGMPVDCNDPAYVSRIFFAACTST
jgi:hypothetical protein